MKKYFLIAFAMCLMGIVTSCSKGLEEKFLADVEEFVKSAENVNSIEGIKDFEDLDNDFYHQMIELYGFNHHWLDACHSLESSKEDSNLKLSEKQYKTLRGLIRRLESAERKMKKIKDGEDTTTDEKEDEITDIEEDISSGSEDWDAMLDEYEKYVDKYIALLKKAKQGDMNALTEYVGMMEQAEELGEKMEDAQGEMSPAQWSRYLNILQKMTNAAQSM